MHKIILEFGEIFFIIPIYENYKSMIVLSQRLITYSRFVGILAGLNYLTSGVALGGEIITGIEVFDDVDGVGHIGCWLE